MKLENLYYAMQERYSAEQEKKEAAEKVVRDELKKGILAIIHSIGETINNNFETLYQAYAEARDKQEESANGPVYISVNNSNYMTMHVGENSVTMELKSDECYDNVKLLNSFLSKSYSYATSNNNSNYSTYQESIQLELKFELNLSNSSISLHFYADNAFYDSGSLGFRLKTFAETIIKKFISDIKEVFPNLQKITEPDNIYSSIDLNINLSEIDILSTPILSTPIEEFCFSTRTLTVARHHGIFTIEDLTQLSEREFKLFRNVGEKTLSEVRQKLEELGLKMKP